MNVKGLVFIVLLLGSSATAQTVNTQRTITSVDGLLLKEVDCPESVTRLHKVRVQCGISTLRQPDVEKFLTPMLAPADVAFYTSNEARSQWNATIAEGQIFVTWHDGGVVVTRGCVLPNVSGLIVPLCRPNMTYVNRTPTPSGPCRPVSLGVKPPKDCRPAER
ncbi:hypothetical protein [Deinococcus peraridilitoris]|uniref:Uncharacterized protein n=1 Tax=Deinococcus peraridilitoris (strain DSM 19664 / LMG 22246 / CIP 109416 / KR-200) TaxID=937777 RepID=L0A255_DEIPD|nr:hypothetical protein [Deinococcus peraridilitoris]AFZ67252.1 hypothetical protein Deipe_1732 [Deinococcus peraridilitoris DSM 19664]